MKVCTYFLFFKIFALTNSLSRIKTKEDHRSIQAVRETVENHSNDNYPGDTKNSDNVHNFIETVSDGKPNLQLVFTAPKVVTLTDFIQETVGILNTYENTAFEDFFHILDFEIRKYHYTGCKFSELMQNHNTRGLLARTLKTIRENTGTFTRANINEIADMLRAEIYDENVKELLDYINSLYKNNASEFLRVLNNLNHYTKTKSKKTHKDLVQVIRDGVRSIIFNHFTELDTHTRRKLKERIEIFWEKFRQSSSSKVKMNNIPDTDLIRKSVSNNIKIFKTIKNKIKERKHVFQSDAQTKFLDKRRRILNKETYNDQSRDIKSKKNESSFESEKFATQESKHKLIARVHSEKQRHAAGTTRVLRSKYDDKTEDTTLNPKSAILTKPTETTIPPQILRAHEEIKPEKSNTITKPPSKYSKKHEYFYKKQPNTLWRSIKPGLNNKEVIVEKVLKDNRQMHKPAKRHDNTAENDFNNYVKEKTKELKNLRNRKTNNKTNKVDVTDVTDNHKLKNKDESKRKFMIQNFMKLLSDLINDEHTFITRSITVKTESTTHPYTSSKPKVVKKIADSATDFYNETTSQVTKKDVNITKTDTEELKKEVISNNVISNDSTFEVTNATRLVSLVTTPTGGIIRRIMVSSQPVEPNRIIRHKNPFDIVNMMFQAQDEKL